MINKEQTESPLDAIIEQIDSYIKNPKTVTRDTLEKLKSEIIDIQDYIESNLDNDYHDEKVKNTQGGGITILLGTLDKKRGESK